MADPANEGPRKRAGAVPSRTSYYGRQALCHWSKATRRILPGPCACMPLARTEVALLARSSSCQSFPLTGYQITGTPLGRLGRSGQDRENQQQSGSSDGDCTTRPSRRMLPSPQHILRLWRFSLCRIVQYKTHQGFDAVVVVVDPNLCCFVLHSIPQQSTYIVRMRHAVGPRG